MSIRELGQSRIWSLESAERKVGVPAEVEPTAPWSSAASPSYWRGLFFVLVATERAWLGPATRDLLALGVGGLAPFAIVGGLATPVLLGTLGKESTATLFGYVLVLDVATLALGQLRGWRAALPAALVGTIVRQFAWSGTKFSNSGAALDHRADRRVVRRPVHGHRRAKEALVGWQQRARSVGDAGRTPRTVLEGST